MIRSVDILDDQGNIITRRWYDSNGNAYRDVDMTNHGNSKTHPEYPLACCGSVPFRLLDYR